MLKILCQYLYFWLRYRVNKENRPIEIISTHPILTQVPRVIHDILDVDSRPQGLYEKVSCQYLYYWLSYMINKENRPIMIMPTYPKLA